MNQKPAITPNEVNTWLRQGIAAARAGQQAQAREMLMQVVEIDEENLLAWLWLSGVVDSLEDRVVVERCDSRPRRAGALFAERALAGP